MGSGLSKEHANAIKNMRPTLVYLFPDGDAAGKVMAQKAAKMLKPLVMRIMKTPKGQDPASLSPDEVKGLLEKATPVLGNVRWTPA
jgi:DNA primase